MRYTRLHILWLLLLGSLSILTANGFCDEPGTTRMGWPLPMSSEKCWQKLPKALDGNGQELPTWARMLAQEMPKTAAAFLELDLAQRTLSPVEPKLRAAMRWIAARDNCCSYAMATAQADAKRSGATVEQILSLATERQARWSENERVALLFAHLMTVDSDSITDELFDDLVRRFDKRQVASMVLLLAYSNFQDRFLNCLGAPLEETGPMPPVKLKFAPDELVSKTTPPSRGTPKVPGSEANGTADVIEDASGFTWLSYPQLQDRLNKQRQRKTRLPIPEWDTFSSNLPKGLMDKPSDIVWYRIAFGYAHELAVPFEIYMRTAGSEVATNWDRLFGNCIFWMVTDAIKCPYCMGHCEMNWEVAGLEQNQIAELSQQLAGSDWSNFTIPQQHALAFARSLTQKPCDVNRHHLDLLREGFGQQQAFFIALNASRYNYMTRISNGFQLTLESENPFWDYYKMKTPDSTIQKTQTTGDAK